MAKFIITCTVTATVRERWSIDADSAEEAQCMFEEAEDGQRAEFVDQEVIGDEEDRSVESVEIDGSPESGPAPCQHCAEPLTSNPCGNCNGFNEVTA